MGTIAENIAAIEKEKEEAARRTGRNPEDVLLCAVTKTHTAEEINEAIRAGVTDIGENRVQEILDKYDKVLPVRWHMIGHLQTNKVKYIIDKVCLIHSVDSFHLAEEIDRRAEQHGIVMDILVQVNAACDLSLIHIYAVGIDGIIMTKLDGDSRGGAALSVKAVTGKPIKFAGMGEKFDALEPFHPERMASRILGMGDMLSLIEKAQDCLLYTSHLR